MAEQTFTEFTDGISKNPSVVRMISEILLLSSSLRERVFQIDQQLEHLRFLDEKVAKYDFRQYKQLRKKYWKLPDEEKVQINRAIMAKRKKLLARLNLEYLQTETEKQWKKHQEYMSRIYVALKTNKTHSVPYYAAEGIKCDQIIMKILRTVELAQRQYLMIIYETINSKGEI